MSFIFYNFPFSIYIVDALSYFCITHLLALKFNSQIWHSLKCTHADIQTYKYALVV